jgi:apolipoprotein N-acyltransferase
LSRPLVQYLLCVAAGALLPLAFAPFHQFWVAPLSYAALFYVWRDAAPRRALKLGFAFGCASFGLGTYWTFIAVRIIGQAPLAIGLLLMIGLTAVLALFVGLAGYAAARWLRTRGAVAWLAALPAVFVLAEWLRSWLFTGFGWLAAGYSQTDTWLMGYAPLGGIHAISLAVLATAGALLTLALGTARERVAAAIAVAAVWGGGLAARGVEFTEAKERSLSVALAQGAIPQEMKYEPEQLRPQLALYAELTRQSAGADLIVWPEAAIPIPYEYVPEFFAGVQRVANEAGSTLIVGALRIDPTQAEAEVYQNILMALTDPTQIYVKRHLVPFGETFPVPGFIRSWMRLMSLPYTDLGKGASDQPPVDAAGERLAIMICYEDVFPAEQLHYLPDATLLVNVSNDGWFGDSLAPHQHLQIARVRAAEAGRYLLRAANPGLSAVIDPRGNVVDVLPQFRAGVLKGVVHGYTGLTPYARVGNYAVVVLAVLVVLAIGAPLAIARAAARRVQSR